MPEKQYPRCNGSSPHFFQWSAYLLANPKAVQVPVNKDNISWEVRLG